MSHNDQDKRILVLECVLSKVLDRMNALETRCAELEKKANRTMPELSKQREKEEQAKNNEYIRQKNERQQSIKEVRFDHLHQTPAQQPVKESIHKPQSNPISAKSSTQKKVVQSNSDENDLFDSDDSDFISEIKTIKSSKTIKTINISDDSDDSDDSDMQF